MLRSMRLMQLKRKYALLWKQPTLPELEPGTLDPDYGLLDTLESHYQRRADELPLHKKTPRRLRSDERMQALVHHQFAAPIPAIADIWNENIPSNNGEVPVRIYLPDGRGPYPITLFLYKGGWVSGDLDTAHASAAIIAHKTGHVVITIDTRKAPEFPFPAALQDCYTVLQWAANEKNALPMRGDAAKISVIGEGTGGNLAAALCLYTRDRQGPQITAQVLIDPVLDLLHSDLLSISETRIHSAVSIEDLKFFIQQYIQDPLLSTDPLVSPLHSEDMSGLPATILALSEFNPLIPQGKEFAEKLQSAGISTEVLSANGLRPDFFSQQHLLPRANQAGSNILDKLSESI